MFLYKCINLYRERKFSMNRVFNFGGETYRYSIGKDFLNSSGVTKKLEKLQPDSTYKTVIKDTTATWGISELGKSEPIHGTYSQVRQNFVTGDYFAVNKDMKDGHIKITTNKLISGVNPKTRTGHIIKDNIEHYIRDFGKSYTENRDLMQLSPIDFKTVKRLLKRFPIK